MAILSLQVSQQELFSSIISLTAYL